MNADRVLGVDVGGTFTDLVLWDGKQITTGKVSTTSDQSEGVVVGAVELSGGRADRFLHGTTVATNALLERKGARTSLITTEGFADVIEIARQDRPSLYDSAIDRARPLVPRGLRYEVPRISSPLGSGAVGETERVSHVLDRGTLAAIGGSDGEGPQAVAISLLYGYARGAQEADIARIVREANPDLTIALSSVVAPEFREYERTSTTVLNAYLMPLFGEYLRQLITRSRQVGLPSHIAVMRSSGGLLPLTEAADLPVAALLSGPAGGVVATAALGDELGKTRLVSFDMGGTSTDACLIENGRPEITYGREIDGYACLQPATAIYTVGAGGGSIAWIDSGGSLRVGPSSAGANPGPASYGRGGTKPTVTDANVALGRIDPAATLAGRLPLHSGLAEKALFSVGRQLDFSSAQTALGVVSVVEEVMAGALRRVSIERGADPREASLVAFGGAGGLHATALARILDMAGVVIPVHAGVFSALGQLLSPPRVDNARTVLIRSSDADRLDHALAAVRDAAVGRLRDTFGESGDVACFVDARYLGQAHEVAVPHAPGDGWEALVHNFHELHAERNGFARLGDPIEAVTVRAEAIGNAAVVWDQLPPMKPRGDAIVGARDVLSGAGAEVATVYRREGLSPGDEIGGPAVIEETDATTYVATDERATVHDSGALEIDW